MLKVSCVRVPGCVPAAGVSSSQQIPIIYFSWTIYKTDESIIITKIKKFLRKVGNPYLLSCFTSQSADWSSFCQQTCGALQASTLLKDVCRILRDMLTNDDGPELCSSTSKDSCGRSSSRLRAQSALNSTVAFLQTSVGHFNFLSKNSPISTSFHSRRRTRRISSSLCTACFHRES